MTEERSKRFKRFNECEIKKSEMQLALFSVGGESMNKIRFIQGH